MREDSNPRYRLGMPVFKTGTLNHSDTHPLVLLYVMCCFCIVLLPIFSLLISLIINLVFTSPLTNLITLLFSFCLQNDDIIRLVKGLVKALVKQVSFHSGRSNACGRYCCEWYEGHFVQRDGELRGRLKRGNALTLTPSPAYGSTWGRKQFH